MIRFFRKYDSYIFDIVIVCILGFVILTNGSDIVKELTTSAKGRECIKCESTIEERDNYCSSCGVKIVIE